jgi:hypothetical protein
MVRPDFNQVFKYVHRHAADARGQSVGEVTPQFKEAVEKFLAGELSGVERNLLFKQVRQDQQAIDYLAAMIRSRKGAGKNRRASKG